MKISRTVFIVILIVFNIVLDQISKVMVRGNVEPHSQTSIIGDVFTLHNVENTGAFLGMGSDLSSSLKVPLLLILPVIVLGLVMVHIIRD